MAATTDPDPVTASVALSMAAADRPMAEITTATGLTEQQLAALTQQTAEDGIADLLAWGEQHPAKGVRALAGRARTALADLAQRRAGEQAVNAAEAEIADLKAALAAAERRRRAARSGAVPAAPAVLTAVPQAATAPGRLEQPADKSTRQRIRAWAREQGMDAPDRGRISQNVLRAWAEHSPAQAPLAQAG